ncbi:alcohol dehydrogenase catalytic domain-containing protein [Streptomyces misionensis]|uniref:alcohol dehydrogenase catalytic domain-containing protein n=1 Tax=Streptomyces misionensis TaxID=67331 RepID=UPI00340AF77A
MLKIVDVPEPHAGIGEIRIAVRASFLPPSERMIRSGQQREHVLAEDPHRTGHDAAGVVDEVGADVNGVQVGDEVLGLARLTGADANSDGEHASGDLALSALNVAHTYRALRDDIRSGGSTVPTLREAADLAGWIERIGASRPVERTTEEEDA